MKPPSKQGQPDDFQTPIEALYPLIPYLKKEWLIWECAAGEGNLCKGLNDFGFNVVSTDIKTGFDFLKMVVPKFDCIITNPPFSLKDEFIERCYRFAKPFALLLPITSFEGKKRQMLFKKYGIQIIFFDKRINFKTPTGDDSGSWFMTAWFTKRLNLPNDINFVEFNHPNQTKII